MSSYTYAVFSYNSLCHDYRFILYCNWQQKAESRINYIDIRNKILVNILQFLAYYCGKIQKTFQAVPLNQPKDKYDLLLYRT